MSKIAAISGGLGDIIYALPTMHKLQVKTLYVKDRALEDGSTTYKAVRGLIQLQGIACEPTDGLPPFFEYEPGLIYDYDLDQARRRPWRGANHIMVSFMTEFNCFMKDWRDPWLEHIKPLEHKLPYTMIMVTPRWREESKVNWERVVRQIKGLKLFTGFVHDYVQFVAQYHCPEVEYVPTEDLLHLARVVQGAEAVYCNQNVSLTMAQGLGKPYFIEKKPYRHNTVMGGKNETIL